MTAAAEHMPARFGGFTLVEVIMALAIVALATGLAYEWVYSAAALTNRNRERTFAEWVALNRIAELRLSPQPHSVGRSSGESELAGATWRWQVEVSETPVDDLLRMEVTVAPADEPERDVITVNAFAGPPLPPSPPLDWYRGAGTPIGQPGGQGGRAGDGDDEDRDDDE